MVLFKVNICITMCVTSLIYKQLKYNFIHTFLIIQDLFLIFEFPGLNVNSVM